MDSIKRPKPRQVARKAMGAPIGTHRARPNNTLELKDIQLEDKQTETVAAPDLPKAATPVEASKPSRKERRQARRAEKKQKRAEKKQRRLQRKWPLRYVTWKRVLAVILIAALAIGGTYAYKVYVASRKILTGVAKLAPALTGDLTQLKGEGDGRVNIALLGIGGGDHDGANLSDTIMIASLDVKTKEVAMVSIPRDLYVPIPGYGSNKINAAHAFGVMYKYPGGGGALAKKTLETNLGVPIHYYAVIDFTGFKKAIDVVGGVDITNKTYLSDPEYPCDKNQYRSCGYKLAPGKYHMDGTAALKYARCRKGTCGDDYGRAARQQEVLVALRAKALSVGTLANPAKVAALIDVVGNDFKTDLNFNEIKKLIGIGKNVDTSKIINKVLTNNPNDGSTPLVQNANIAGASVVIPTAGIGNFAAIKAFMRSVFVDTYIRSENAKIELQNGTTRPGLAASTSAVLKSYQYNIIKVGTAETTDHATSIIYDYSGGKKPITIQYLENRFGVKAIRATLPASTTPATTTTTGTAATTTENPDIRIIIGRDYVPGE